MTRKLLLFFTLVSITNVIAQPAGRLYINGNQATVNEQGIFGYITYPLSNYHHIDSVDANDFLIAGDSIYVADSEVRIYNRVTEQLVDSISGVDASRLSVWDNHLLTIANAKPFLRVFDRNSNSMLYAIDSLKLTYKPVDFLITDNRAFILLYDSVLVLDLVTQDTLLKFHTPHPFPFSGQNQHILEINNIIYVDVYYATGAPRFSLIQIDKSNYNVTTTFHFEGAEYFSRPVSTLDSIFLGSYNSHYRISLDTFFSAPMNFLTPLTFDSESDELFVFDSQNTSILNYSFGTLNGSFPVSNYIKQATFVSDVQTGIGTSPDPENISIYPNPSTGELFVQLKNELPVARIVVCDISGKEVFRKKLTNSENILRLDFSNLSAGFYTMEITTGYTPFRRTFLVNH